MNKKFIGFGLTAVSLLAPAYALAAETNAFRTVRGLLTDFGKIVEAAIGIAFALGVLGFFWGMAMYIFSAGDEEKKKEGKSIMFWGVIALFVMVSVFGIIKLLQTTLGIEPASVTVPRVNL